MLPHAAHEPHEGTGVALTIELAYERDDTLSDIVRHFDMRVVPGARDNHGSAIDPRSQAPSFFDRVREVWILRAHHDEAWHGDFV